MNLDNCKRLVKKGRKKVPELRQSPICQNFERPFTPQNHFRSASNFAKTRFRRSPTFHDSSNTNLNVAMFLKFLIDRLPPEDGSVWPQTLPKHVSDDPRRFIFRRQKYQIFAKCSQTLDGRLPSEDGSDLAETWPKRVSEDSQHFIF